MGEAAARETVAANSLRRRAMCHCTCISVYVCVLVQNEASKCKAESSEQTKFARESIQKDAKYVSSALLALDYLKKSSYLKGKKERKKIQAAALYISYVTNLTTFLYAENLGCMTLEKFEWLLHRIINLIFKANLL